MNTTELNKLFIPDITNIITDFCVGYDKQIAEAHHNKKTFNAIMKHIFNNIYNPYNDSHLFPLMFSIHENYTSSITTLYPITAYIYDPLIIEYRKKHIDVEENDSSSVDAYYEQLKRRRCKLQTDPTFKTFIRIYQQNKEIIEEVQNKLDLERNNRINAIRLGLI